MERYTVTGRNATAFRVQWSELELGEFDAPSSGVMDFNQTDAGLVNVNYQSTAPPPQFPILCAAAGDCGNSLAGAWYLLIWGTRSPLLAEPLLTGTRWNTVGGAGNDVASRNRYVGRAKVTVPAFPAPLDAAVVESSVTQTGALGDPFGSGSRTVWWVRGVGPVRIVFRHSGGQVSEAVLRSTTLTPKPPPPDTNLLPLNRGDTVTLRWRNDRHLKQWSTQRLTVARRGQQHLARGRQAGLRPDHRRGQLRVLDAAGRRAQPRGLGQGGDPRRSSPRWGRARNRRTSGGGS